MPRSAASLGMMITVGSPCDPPLAGWSAELELR